MLSIGFEEGLAKLEDGGEFWHSVGCSRRYTCVRSILIVRTEPEMCLLIRQIMTDTLKPWDKPPTLEAQHFHRASLSQWDCHRPLGHQLFEVRVSSEQRLLIISDGAN